MKKGKAKLRPVQDLEQENCDLVARCLELIEIIGWDDDDTYTFDDGERWAKFDPSDQLTTTFKLSNVEGRRE